MHDLNAAIGVADRADRRRRATAMLDRAAPFLFLLGLAILAAGALFFAGKYRFFPYDALSRAEASLRGVWQAYLRPPPMDRPARPGTPATAGAITHDAARVAPGATFIAAYTEAGFAGFLVGQDGARLWQWNARFSEVFPSAPHLHWQARDGVIAWQGVRLLENGDLIFNFQDWSFPYGSGLVRLDKDSKVVWALPRNTHHDVAVDDAGRLLVPAQHYRPEGLPGLAGLRPWYYEDTILVVTTEGEVVDEISVLGAFLKRRGALLVGHGETAEIAAEDPLHLNSVKSLPRAWADRFPLFESGDLLVSLRNINTIAVISRTTREVEWTMVGPFIMQHDAEFLPNGNILLYDNQGGEPRCGGTRLLEIEPVRQKIVWSYDGCAGTPFASETRGMQQPLPGGNVLTIEPHGGRVLEIARDGALVWEYYNVLPGGERVGVVTHAERVPSEALRFAGPAAVSGRRAGGGGAG